MPGYLYHHIINQPGSRKLDGKCDQSGMLSNVIQRLQGFIIHNLQIVHLTERGPCQHFSRAGL